MNPLDLTQAHPIQRAPRRRLALLRKLVPALLLALAPLLGAGQAAVVHADDTCAPSGTQATCTFSYTGAAQTWTVPVGVTSATFDLFGAAGADGGDYQLSGPQANLPGSAARGGSGGLGGEAKATLPVTPGATLQINVGRQGGGGPGGAPFAASNGSPGGGGGGASDVRSGGFTLGERLIGGGGGGGGGGAGLGINSAQPGGNGQAGDNGGGSGLLGTGGAGISGGGKTSGGGGGGGAGAYGGSGGIPGFYDPASPAMGGQGGTGGGPVGTSLNPGVRYGDGLVTISYTLPTPVSVLVSGFYVNGMPRALFTSTTNPAGLALTGTLTCTRVGEPNKYDLAIDAHLNLPGGYTLNGATCSGLSAPSGYSVAGYQGVPGGFVVSTPLPGQVEGARIRQTGTVEIYLIDTDGTKRYIPDPPTYLNLFRDWNGIQEVADVSGIATGPAVTSGAYLAIAQETMQTVYLVDNGQKRGVTSPAVMDTFYFNWGQIQQVPQSTLDALPTGLPIT